MSKTTYLKRAKRYIRRCMGAGSKVQDEELQVKNAEIDAVREEIAEFDFEHIWAFNAGQAGQDFRGNPKYLFAYVNNYRKDIFAYWICNDDETIEEIRQLGFHAYNQDSILGQYLLPKTGAYIAEQVKERVPAGFYGKYINLWHGIGMKRVERAMRKGPMAMNFAKKYISGGTFYHDNELLLVTSPKYKTELGHDCGIKDNQFIEAGYPRCTYQRYFKPLVTFDHDILGKQGLDPDARIVVYAPTYRNGKMEIFSEAFPDLEHLYRVCEEENLLMIFKLHPRMEDEVGFKAARETYAGSPHFLFWDNRYDFYEIMDKVDLAIYDYSSIFSDMVAVDIPYYIRYVYDYDDYFVSTDSQGAEEYLKRTAGRICKNFDSLLDGLRNYQQTDNETQELLLNLKEELWSYSKGKDDLENIVHAILDFHPIQDDHGNLYSFDIFDTLFSRTVLDPEGIFFRVKEDIIASGKFSPIFESQYPSIRKYCESNVREEYRKDPKNLESKEFEIQFDDIFDRMQDVYGLNDEQVQLLKQYELDAELDSVIPLTERIEEVKSLVAEGNTVVLISDMYLPESMVRKMLIKADPILGELPLFLSSKELVQKTTRELFRRVYDSFEPYYNFANWIHCGDNRNADVNNPKKLGIKPKLVEKPEYNVYQNEMVQFVDNYDSYLVAAMQARMCDQYYYEKDEFVISFVALCLVPYVDWVIRDAQKRGYEMLYFISRDGHHLKRIADAIIQERGLDIETKYIYASRKTWRIPSFITEIDDDFWTGHGNFGEIENKDKLFKAMALDEEHFHQFFPSIDPDNIDYVDKATFRGYVEVFRSSEDYKGYLLDLAKETRKLVSGYLEQEIDPKQNFAVVEYWGRGYTQDCMVRLWRDILKDDEAAIPFYYSRSIYSSMGGSIRHDFTTNNGRQIFIEAIFANMPYKSITEYTRDAESDKIVPVLNYIDYDKSLFNSMENLLPEFARRYAQLELLHPEDTDRMLYSFVFDFYTNNAGNPELAESMGTLVDSVAQYGSKREYAPPYTMQNIADFADKTTTRGAMMITSDVVMSVARSEDDVQAKYRELYQIFPGEKMGGGRFLNENGMKISTQAKADYKSLKKKSKKLNEYYLDALAHVTDRQCVGFFEKGKSFNNDGFKRVERAISRHSGVKSIECCVGRYSSDRELRELAEILASCSQIVIRDAIGLFASVEFSDDTNVILLPSDALFLAKKGLIRDYVQRWKEKYKRYEWSGLITDMQIPSKDAEHIYRKNYTHNAKVDCTLLGCSSTDIYFEENKHVQCCEKLAEIFPESAGKKIILYMPTLKLQKLIPEWAQILDMELLQRLIGDEYVVVIHINENFNVKNYRNPLEIPGFSKVIKKSSLDLRELMIASDVVIGDYRDRFFEAVFLNRPMYRTTDYELLFSEPRIAYANYSEFEICPEVHSPFEIAEALKHVDQYDYSKQNIFREKMFSGCDGHSAERAAQFIIDKLNNK